jgi:hypothetical protein
LVLVLVLVLVCWRIVYVGGGSNVSSVIGYVECCQEHKQFLAAICSDV